MGGGGVGCVGTGTGAGVCCVSTGVDIFVVTGAGGTAVSKTGAVVEICSLVTDSETGMVWTVFDFVNIIDVEEEPPSSSGDVKDVGDAEKEGAAGVGGGVGPSI